MLCASDPRVKRRLFVLAGVLAGIAPLARGQSSKPMALLASAGGEATPGTPEQFGALIQAERVRYEKLIREADIKAD
jgi:hypothetical protein